MNTSQVSEVISQVIIEISQKVSGPNDVRFADEIDKALNKFNLNSTLHIPIYCMLQYDWNGINEWAREMEELEK